jgi:hypothetical protein
LCKDTFYANGKKKKDTVGVSLHPVTMPEDIWMYFFKYLCQLLLLTSFFSCAGDKRYLKQFDAAVKQFSVKEMGDSSSSVKSLNRANKFGTPQMQKEYDDLILVSAYYSGDFSSLQFLSTFVQDCF